MWAGFFSCFAIGALALLAPGLMVCRGVRMPWPLALACSPGCTTALYCLIALALSQMGVLISGGLLLGVALSVSLLLFLILRAICRRGAFGAERTMRRPSVVLGWELGLYIAVGVLSALVILVRPFADPSMPTQAWDNVFHFGVVRAFLDSGDWSFMNVAQYKTAGDQAIDPYPDMRFYPAAWHIFTALLADVTHAPVALAANASNTLFAGLVFPMGMFALLWCLFPDRRSAVALGAVSCVSFVAFPWALYTSWQLFPNAAAMAVLPSLVFLFVAMGERRADMGRRQLALPFGLTLVAVAILQPNAAFSAAVFLAPYCVWFASRLPKRLCLSGRRLMILRALAALLAIAAISSIWVMLYHAPFLEVIVDYHWASYATLCEAMANALALSLSYNPPQYVLAIFVLVGLAVSFRRARTAWIAFSYGFALVIFVVATATDGSLKHLLAGFWYTDPCRVGALLAFAAMPLAALGMSACYRLFVRLPRLRDSFAARLLLAIAVGLGCFWGAFFVPEEQGEGEGRHLETPFAYLEKQNRIPDSTEEAERRRPYNEEKAAFAAQVKELVGDSIVINQPYDGSMYLYGVDGLHLLYRHINGYGDKGETEESRIIREHLDLYASDPVVQEAVRRSGARYVLLLAADGQGIGRFTSAYDPEQWKGISDIGPQTPGFTLVLARGNMRLYRIDDLASDMDTGLWGSAGLSGNAS